MYFSTSFWKCTLWFLFLTLIFPNVETLAWGFYAHKKINYHAVFSLPPELIGFYKAHIHYISENAVNPDKRRYAVKGEAEKHFLDADAYGDSAIYTLPRYWEEAVAQYGEDSLRAHGIAPWSTYSTYLQLVRAMQSGDSKTILRLSADLGHYVGDIHVPLHTTKNYNGQLTGQYGIHAFWESRIPELLSSEYDFFVGKAAFVEKPQLAIWEIITRTHEAVDSVLQLESQLAASWPEQKKYSYEERNGLNTRVHSKAYTMAFHAMLNGQVERQLRNTIKFVADLWYTAWINAGQPILPKIGEKEFMEKNEEFFPLDDLKHIREHEDQGKKTFPPFFNHLKFWEERTSKVFNENRI
ncbi:zinc dependent phospholipase C family protein [Pleomorphovibrio marinus]|uniref:zinc dependent phospholipase C family protein n=1 Tax=Pleomorphovibrio marinus TaxID=2164132 RepID=UPI0018E51857|nr:zinc dependent phospholipase C family protein [Pleomorphovibrio marinus]